MRPLLAFLLLVGVASAAPVPKAVKQKNDDAAQLVGTWATVPGGGSAYTFTFDADGGVRSASGSSAMTWTWTVDTTQTPKRMRWVNTDNPKTSWECVYELTDDTLRIGFIAAGQAPPAKVEVTPGVTLYEMKREPAAK